MIADDWRRPIGSPRDGSFHPDDWSPPISTIHRTWVPEDPEFPAREDLHLSAELAAEVEKSAVLRVQPIPARDTHSWIVHVEAADVSVVVRLAREGKEEPASNDYRKEAWCLDRAAGIGLGRPRAMARGERDGRPYLVLAYVPGESGVGVPMNVLGAWKELGAYASRMAEIRASGFGSVLADSEEGRFTDPVHDGWREQIERNIAALTPDDPLLRLGVYDRGRQDSIREDFGQMLSEEWSFGLGHTDLVPANAIVDGDGETHLMDWSGAAVDVWPEAVAAANRRLLYVGKATPAAVGWFLDGMELPDSQSAHFRTRVERVMLLKAFDLVRWALDVDEPRLEDIAADAAHVWRGHRLGSHEG